MASRLITPTLENEKNIWCRGLTCVAGLDEAGRGAWAGPVYAGAVALPSTLASEVLLEQLNGVRDSKLMTPLQRARWAERIQKTALSWGVGSASHEEIDTLGIVPATRLAMRRALEALNPAPQALLIDALRLPEVKLPQQALVRGDSRVLSIAAASVLAKTARDAWMCALDAECPGYSFARHKGYGTAVHRQALERLGPSPYHRRSFAPLRMMIDGLPFMKDKQEA